MANRERAALGETRTSPLYIAFVSVALSTVTAFGDGCSSCAKGRGATADGSPSRTTKGGVLTIPARRAAYVTNNASDTLSVIDRDAELVETVPIDLDPTAREAPHHLAVDADAKVAFVALAFPPEPTKKKDPHAGHGNASDVGTLARLDLGSLAVREARDVDENPGDVVLTHDKSRVLVTHFDMKRAMDVAARGGASPATMFASLIVLRARDLTRLGSRPICVAPHGMAVTDDDKNVFVACYGSDELAVVDLSADGFPVSRYPLGASQGVPGAPRYGPYSAVLAPDGATVVVADLEGQDVRVFDRGEKRFLERKTVPLAAKAFMPAFVEAQTVLVPTQAPDGLVRVDLSRAAVEKRATFPKDQCSLPHVVRIAKDGRVYLVCEGDHRSPGSVLQIDPATLAVLRRWSVGAYPDGIAFGDE